MQRFKGQEGHKRLVEVFADHELVQHNEALAQQLAAVAKLKEYKKSQDVIVEQQESKYQLYFILTGKCDLLIGGSPVRVVESGETVGELPILDRSFRHTVTLRARERSVIATVPELQFRSIAKKCRVLWENMATALSKRLYETRGYKPQVTSKKVFIVHGHEAVKYELAHSLEKVGVDVTILHEQVEQGRTIIEKFSDHAAEAGFAVVLFTADDVGKKSKSADPLRPRARQNVVFEMGFFFGLLGRGRVCAVYDADIDLPSDLSGLARMERDSAGNWKHKVAREINAAGIEVDFGKFST
jgi:predicted nucleotide-binding protein